MGASIPHHHYYGSFDYSLMCSDEEAAAAASNIFSSSNGGSAMNMMLSASPLSLMSSYSADRLLDLPQMSEIHMPFPNCDYTINHGFEDYCTSTGLIYNPMPAQNWGGKVADDDQVKVGRRYSVEERKDRILRYLNKRNHRNFNKTIKYACRKTLADKRVRVRGRFAKNSEASQTQEEEDDDDAIFINTITTTTPTTTTPTPLHHFSANYYTSSFHDDESSSSSSSFQMIKYDEDYWFQAAMDNIGNLPYL